jgi:hypothetical protein
VSTTLSDTDRSAPTVDGAVPRVVVWVAVALVAVPFVVAALSVIGVHWNPAGDQAIEVMRIRDVGTSHTPLIGQWSRWGWSHPGPLTFWLLAPLARTLGNDGTLLGTAMLNLAAAVGIVIAAARVAPAVAVLAGAITGVLAHAVGLDFLIFLWNPWAAFFPFVLFLVLVWIVATGRTGWLAVAVAVGSYVLQAHAGYLALTVGLLAIAAVRPVRDAFRRPRAIETADPSDSSDLDAGVDTRRRARRALVVAAIVGIVVWLPPLVQEVTGDPGNLTEIARYARSDQPTVGWDVAFGTMGIQLRPDGPWVRDDEQNAVGFERQGSTAIALVTIAAAAVLGALAFRRGHRAAGHLAIVTLGAVGLALVSTARVTGVLLPYVIGFWRPIAAITYLSIVFSVLVLVADRTAWRAATAVGLALLAAIGIAAVVDEPAMPPVPSLSRAIGALGPRTEAALRPGARYLVQGQDFATLNGGVAGLALYLETHGAHVFLQREALAALRFGKWRVATPEQVEGRVILVSGPALAAGWPAPAGAHAVADFDPLDRAERARATRLEARIRLDTGADAEALLSLDAPIQRDLAVQQGARRADVEALGQLQQRGQAYRVYVVQP